MGTSGEPVHGSGTASSGLTGSGDEMPHHQRGAHRVEELHKELRAAIGNNVQWGVIRVDSMVEELIGNYLGDGSPQQDALGSFRKPVGYDEDEHMPAACYLQGSQNIHGDKLKEYQCPKQIHEVLVPIEGSLCTNTSISGR